MDIIFLDEFGVQPVGYIGIVLDTAETKDSLHNNLSNKLEGILIADIKSSIHLLTTDNLNTNVIAGIYNSIHSNQVHYKFNAPARLICDRYIFIGFESMYLETEFDNNYLETPEEEYYLDTPCSVE